MKNKPRTPNLDDMPELTAEDFKRARHFTPEERESFRLAIERKLGRPCPPRVGRPPKKPEEKYVPISWRTPPEVKEWLETQARRAGVEKYQSFLSILLRSMIRYEAVREKNGIALRLPNSDQVIHIQES
ncbi:MAG: hypothetical protein ACHQ2Z_02980 [Elusimicrobiota bacterium]